MPPPVNVFAEVRVEPTDFVPVGAAVDPTATGATAEAVNDPLVAPAAAAGVHEFVPYSTTETSVLEFGRSFQKPAFRE